jgi:hypothetical protein
MPKAENTHTAIVAIGHRLHELAEKHHAADSRNAEAEMALLLSEETFLRDLALEMRPKTLEDAAVQIGVLFVELGHLSECETSLEDYETGVQRARRVTAGLTTVLCRLAGVHHADAGDVHMAVLLKRWGPGDAGDAT